MILYGHVKYISNMTQLLHLSIEKKNTQYRMSDIV